MTDADCNDSDPCTYDLCSAGACVHTAPDCNTNGHPDCVDIAEGVSQDCNSTGIPDECELAGNDCNANGVPDECDIADGTSQDTDANGIPDECERGQGLLATYLDLSTGSLIYEGLEGPVFHGYWSQCSDTANNLYQGVCTPSLKSPVYWAWDYNFSVTWTGFLYAPVGGDYRFSSYYWVDGVVFIAVNGTVVADLDTTGGGYSAVVPLQQGTWVPVVMSFVPNGGSNNMHLGWVPPAAGATWEPVPRQYLAPPKDRCSGDQDCDDKLFCNGSEGCDGTCYPGSPPCGRSTSRLVKPSSLY